MQNGKPGRLRRPGGLPARLQRLVRHSARARQPAHGGSRRALPLASASRARRREAADRRRTGLHALLPAELLFETFSQRYGKGSTIITSNLRLPPVSAAKSWRRAFLQTGARAACGSENPPLPADFVHLRPDPGISYANGNLPPLEGEGAFFVPVARRPGLGMRGGGARATARGLCAAVRGRRGSVPAARCSAGGVANSAGTTLALYVSPPSRGRLERSECLHRSRTF